MNATSLNTHLQPQAEQRMTFAQAMTTASKSSLMISVVTAIALEHVMDTYQPEGRNKYVVIGAAVYLSNVLGLYLKNNGY